MEAVVREVASSMGFTIKNEQLKVVKQFLNGNDVFVIFPTGFGKSLCFAVLPGVFNRLRCTEHCIFIVVSPLISIMEDLLSSFKSKGIKAAYIHKDMKDVCQERC